MKSATKYFIFNIVALILIAVFLYAISLQNASASARKPEKKLKPFVVKQIKPPTRIPVTVQATVITPKIERSYICEYSDGFKSSSIILAHQSLYGTVSAGGATYKVVLKGDCYYRWEVGKSYGSKTCGISTYLPLIQFKLPAFSVGAVASAISTLEPGIGVNRDYIENILGRCIPKYIDPHWMSVQTNVKYAQ